MRGLGLSLAHCTMPVQLLYSRKEKPVRVAIFSSFTFAHLAYIDYCVPILSRVRRYRRHLIPLTDRDGSDDSDEEEELDLREPAFMVHTSHDTRVITSYTVI